VVVDGRAGRIRRIVRLHDCREHLARVSVLDARERIGSLRRLLLVAVLQVVHVNANDALLVVPRFHDLMIDPLSTGSVGPNEDDRT
jgi:hypothetical protein